MSLPWAHLAPRALQQQFLATSSRSTMLASNMLRPTLRQTLSKQRARSSAYTAAARPALPMPTPLETATAALRMPWSTALLATATSLPIIASLLSSTHTLAFANAPAPIDTALRDLRFAAADLDNIGAWQLLLSDERRLPF